MPWRAPRVCSFPGCTALVRAKRPRCPKHPYKQEKRPSYRKRGYVAKDWDKIRAAQLAREPRCRSCGAPARVVDHIVAKQKGGTDASGNLQSLCRSCHSSKTARYDRGFGNPARDPREGE